MVSLLNTICTNNTNPRRFKGDRRPQSTYVNLDSMRDVQC